jgi:transposase InsO family protein
VTRLLTDNGGAYCGQAFAAIAQAAALRPYLHWNNSQRSHTTLGWRTPQQRLWTLNNVLVNDI